MSPFFSLSRKKAVFFDMNNTLIDRRQCFDAAFAQVIADYTARWDPDSRTATPQETLQSYKLEWSRRRRASDRPSYAPGELRQLCLQKALEPYPVHVQSAFTHAFFNEVEEKEDSFVTLFPGVEETLAALAQSYRLAIISNGVPSRLHAIWGRLGLAEWIPEDRLFTSSGEAQRKPHPHMFEHAMKSIGVSPSQSLMVGNSWRNDILGATSCGMDAIWIHPSHIKKVSQRSVGKQKVMVVRTFKQLRQALLPAARH